MLAMADALAGVSISAVEAVWERWIGPARFARKLAQFERVGWVQTMPAHRGLERIVRLTESGRAAALGGRDPEACWGRPWDGKWRLVLFDVPESRMALRTKLRRRLRALHFGYLQNSVWASPDPADVLNDVMRGAGVDVETFTLMEARPCGGETDYELVLGAWDFDRINRFYDQYLEILRACPGRMGTRASRRGWFEIEWRSWCRALGSDPLLPETLLPRSYRGREAWKRRKARLSKLLEGGLIRPLHKS